MSGRTGSNTSIIALTTDFGSGSAYVAQMKGVLLSCAPNSTIIDLCHDIRAHDVRHAELFMRSVAFALPLGTIHIVVVDPGVGTDRRPIAVEAAGCYFVGPDNGVLSPAIERGGARVVHLDRPHLFRSEVSATFHGRDIFAPIAAELANGLALTEVGSIIHDPIPGGIPKPRRTPHGLLGEVIDVDRFGNLLTNIPVLSEPCRIKFLGQELDVVETYGAAESGALFALRGSGGFFEIALCAHSAAALVPDAVGTAVECVPSRVA